MVYGLLLYFLWNGESNGKCCVRRLFLFHCLDDFAAVIYGREFQILFRAVASDQG